MDPIMHAQVRLFCLPSGFWFLFRHVTYLKEGMVEAFCVHSGSSLSYLAYCTTIAYDDAGSVTPQGYRLHHLFCYLPCSLTMQCKGTDSAETSAAVLHCGFHKTYAILIQACLDDLCQAPCIILIFYWETPILP